VTSALDPEAAADILQKLVSWRHANITLMVTHHLGFAKAFADQIIFLDHGKIVEMGPGSRVLTAPEKARTQAFVTAAEMY
jgi:polar amino acid transport system ATP-binding protein